MTIEIDNLSKTIIEKDGLAIMISKNVVKDLLKKKIKFVIKVEDDK